MTEIKKMHVQAVARYKTGSLDEPELPCTLSKPDAPCTFIIFGASGDLTGRKLIPALYRLHKDGCLPTPFTILGVARSDMDTVGFRKSLKRSLQTRSGLSLGGWPEFERHIFYTQLDTENPDAYVELEKYWRQMDGELNTSGNRVIYLATPPYAYGTIAKGLGVSGMSGQHEAGLGWSRVIIEKPFGFDSESAAELNERLSENFDESQIFRIDQNLTKETVQNLLAFRFANTIFDTVWNCGCIEQVQILAAESLGVENRGAFYERIGVLRDVFQTHLLQVLAVCAMEPPRSFDSDGVWDENMNVFRSLQPFDKDGLEDSLLLGQYSGGWVRGTPVPGYRNENGVAKDSNTPTFAFLKVALNNDRWRGVPFYLISGKRLPRKETRIVIRFKPVAHTMFHGVQPSRFASNTLVIGVQPDEAIDLTFQTKLPGGSVCLRPVGMSFDYLQGYDGPVLDSYERALIDCMEGDHMVFWRRDGLDASWNFMTPIIEACEQHPDPDALIRFYEAGTWGPSELAQMLEEPAWGGSFAG